ncbi:J domain-containing protein [Niabella sp. CC-SYL272]|uniref:J domain-containing protein n=1 Tax=Niabella agricola TaxID=2891571 RepID=UPI001F376C92|nr:J domain-containing protein [Niabella agricola]MCF3108641.1 J domain-containing protein [Niabella agricola]
MKDYYQILGLPPSATIGEIKMAYRKLAHLYHPDKNPSDDYAAVQFSLVKEAYDTLTRADLKAQYLQERWLHQTMGQRMAPAVTTPPQVLQALLQAHQQLIHYDAYRVDKKGLYQTLEALIAPSRIDILNHFKEEQVNKEVIRWMADSIFLLYPEDQLRILDQLKQINAPAGSRDLIEEKEKMIRRTIRLNRYKPFLILGLIILLCMIIAYSL